MFFFFTPVFQKTCSLHTQSSTRAVAVSRQCHWIKIACLSRRGIWFTNSGLSQFLTENGQILSTVTRQNSSASRISSLTSFYLNEGLFVCLFVCSIRSERQKETLVTFLFVNSSATLLPWGIGTKPLVPRVLSHPDLITALNIQNHTDQI